MSKEKMVDVVTDLQLAYELQRTKHSEYRDLEKREMLFNGILEKHGITKGILDSSLVWYSDHSEVYLKVNDSVISRLKAQQSKYEKQHMLTMKKGNKGLRQQSVPSSFYLSSENPVFWFSLDSLKLKNYTSYSSLSLNFNFLGLSDKVKINAALMFEYPDTVERKEIQVLKDFNVIENRLFAGRPLKRLTAYIHAESDIPYFNILIYNIELRGDSLEMPKFGVIRH